MRSIICTRGSWTVGEDTKDAVLTYSILVLFSCDEFVVGMGREVVMEKNEQPKTQEGVARPKCAAVCST